MSLPEEGKIKLEKMLRDVETPEVKLTERCSSLLKEFRKRFQSEVDKDEGGFVEEVNDNPYIVDKIALDVINRKLIELRAQDKRASQTLSSEIITSSDDPKRPWRTNTSKEKLLRINNELKRHKEKCSEKIDPMSSEQIQKLINYCEAEGDTQPAVLNLSIRDAIDADKKNLPNLQYQTIENSTVTEIFQSAHNVKSERELEPEDSTTS